MGYHYVNGALVADNELDASRPEALIYEASEGVWFANIRSARNGLTDTWMAGKNGRHASPFSVGVSIRPIAPQRTSSRCYRERSTTNTTSRVSAKTEAPPADDLRPGILDHSPQPVV